jgi:hypothetical protein
LAWPINEVSEAAGAGSVKGEAGAVVLWDGAGASAVVFRDGGYGVHHHDQQR